MRKLLFSMMAVLLFCGQVLAQTRSVSGTVTDAQGSPLPNVSVIIKGTSNGTTTDEAGVFSLNVPANATLVFTAIGMQMREVSVGNQSVINVSLTSSERNLEEVVVVGYGTQKRADLTGVVATVKGQDIENQPFTSIDRALQGTVAGLQSVASSGQPGANQAILIRGVSSINSSNSPLWVVDGVPINTGDASRLQTTANLLSTLNPNDIESISVLKDAASQSIYGSRAANGVIIVTTKKGRGGKTRFRFDVEAGQSDIAYENDRYRPLNAAEWFTITREGLLNAGTANANNVDAIMRSNFGYENGIDFNWYENTRQKGKQQQYNISAEGGNDKTTFFISGGHFVQEGTTINSKMERTNGNMRITHKPIEKLTLNVNVNGGVVNQRAPLSGGAFGNPVLSSFFLLPSYSAFREDGSYNYALGGGLHNTIALSEIDKRFLRQFSLRGSLSAEYEILKNLTFRSAYGSDYNVLEEDQYNNPFHGDGLASNGRAYSYYTRYYNWIWTNTLNYNANITANGDLSTNVQVGYEAQKSSGYFNSVQAQDFPATTALVYPSVGARPTTASATISEYSFLSQFATANLNWQNKYVISGSFRRDGSSRFGVNNQYGNFWSVGATWNVDQEAFMQNVDFISQLKLRSSYGVNGNANIGNYDWLPLYSYGANYNQQPGSFPSNVGDSSLTWELNKPFNVGIDVSFLNNRINLSADYYVRRTEDLFLNLPLSRTSGFSSTSVNIGEMENKGFEVTLNVVPVRTKDFNWTVDFNFAQNKNTITSLPDEQDITDPTSTLMLLRQGESIRTFYLREYAGVNPETGRPQWYTDGTHTTTTETYAQAARSLVGSSLPKYFGSFTNTFNYKGLSLDLQFYYNFGNYVYDSWGSYYAGAGFGGSFNKVARVLERWQKPGDVTDMPQYRYGGNNNFQSSSTFWYAKGDFIRQRNVQLGYRLPQDLASKIKMGNVFFYARGTNLFTFATDENLAFDPEQGTGSATNLNVFIPKTVTVGVNIAF